MKKGSLPMNGPMPQDAPDPNRPGWVLPAPLPPYPPSPYSAYGAYPAMAMPPSGSIPPPHAASPRTCSEATISLVCGIAGWIFLPVICPILAIIFGIRAKQQIRASYDGLTGGGMANAGIILGVVNLALTILGGLIALLAFAFLVAGFAAGMAIRRL